MDDTEFLPHVRLMHFAWNQNDLQESLSFVPGLNLLGERDQSESKQIQRTIVLRLIRYAMGGSDSRIDDEVRGLTKDVELQFLANGRLIKTSRTFEHPTGKFPVQVEGHPAVHHLNPHEMGIFLLEVLHIPKVRYQAGESKQLISFNDIARAWVVDRDFSYTEILNKMFPEPRTEVVKLLLGLTTQEIANVEEEIRDVELETKRLNEEIRGVEKLLSDFKVRGLLEIQASRGQLLAQLEKNELAEKILREKIKLAASHQTDEVPKSEEYVTLSEELLAKRSRLESVESELGVLERQIQEKTDLKDMLANEVQKLERHVSSEYVLSSFTFSRCPRCLRKIEVEMREREGQGDCMLCGRAFQMEEMFDIESWKKVVADASKAVQEADQLLSFYENSKRSLTEERNMLQTRLNRIQAELSRQTSAFVSPLVEDLSLLNTQRTEILTQLSALELEEKQRRYVIMLHDEYLPNLRAKVDKLQNRLRELESARGRKAQRIEGLLTHFSYFMRETASAEFKEAGWDEGNYFPKINGQEHFRSMTGFDLAICVLAFHYALLALKVRPPRFDTAHPGLLLVDEPQQQMMGSSHYKRIMELFSELSQAHGEQIQIVVSATNVAGFEQFIQPITSRIISQ